MKITIENENGELSRSYMDIEVIDWNLAIASMLDTLAKSKEEVF